MTKMTKKDWFNYFKTLDGVTADAIAFCDKEIAALDHKADKARENAAKKAAEGDPLMDAVYAVLTDEPMTGADILAALADEDLTVNKVIYRANALTKTGKVAKTEVVIPAADGVKARKLVAFTKA